MKFSWTKREQQVFDESKDFLIGKRLLVHYDPHKVLVLACDASPYGIGAVLSHLIDGEERPIMFVSSSLSPAEKNYSQLHREALAIIFGVKRFHKYLYGNKFLIYSDHQPLKEIFGPTKNTPSVAAARLQRWAVFLSMYTYEIVYRKSKYMCHADALSRLPVEDLTHIDEVMINSLSNKDSEFLDFNKIKTETLRDSVLLKVYTYLRDGWPSQIDSSLRPYFEKRNELSIEEKCIFYGNRIIIPNSLQDKILNLLHLGHSGIVRSKIKARGYCWFPGIDQMIEDKCNTCGTCQVAGNKTSTSDLVSWPLANFPFERVHVDFFKFQGCNYLIYNDSYSKWTYIASMKSLNAANVKDELRKIFALVGFPKNICSDNGPPFQGSEYVQFCQSNGINVLKSPPWHPQSNGQAEVNVRTAKQTLKKFFIDFNSRDWTLKKKISQFMFYYNNTPTSTTKCSPNEILFKFKPRTEIDAILPTNKPEKCLKRGGIDNKRKSKTSKVLNSKLDDSTNQIVEFKDGEPILYKSPVQDYVNWLNGFIIKRISQTLYQIDVQGSIRIAHAAQIKKCKNKQLRLSENQYCTIEQSKRRRSKSTVIERPLRRSARIKEKLGYRSS